MSEQPSGFVAARDRALIETLAAACDLTLASEVVEGLGRYLELLSSWNRKLDLTGARDAAAQVEVLLLDPLRMCGFDVVPQSAHLIDVGSGAGSPALPLAILRPDLRVCCVEPMRKRVAFLRTVLGSLGLAPRVRVLEQRLQDQDTAALGGPFDVAASRATFAPAEWLARGVRLADRVVVLGGAAPLPEPPEGFALQRRPYLVPSSGGLRALGIYVRV